jgi:hypothetical protein
MKPRVQIDNWRIVGFGEHQILVGQVFGHERIDNGRWTRTSLIEEVRDDEVETLNTIYELGNRLVGDIPDHVQERLDLLRSFANALHWV